MKERARKVVRKIRQEANHPGWRRYKAIRWVIGIGLTLSVAALFPRAHVAQISGYAAGSLWTGEDVTAPFSYPVYKDGSRYRQDSRKAMEELYPVYVPDTTALRSSLLAFRSGWASLSNLLAKQRVDSLDPVVLTDTLKSLGLTSEDWKGLLQATAQARNPRQLEELEPYLAKQIEEIEARQLVTDGSTDEASVSNAKLFSLRVHAREELILNRDSLVTLEAARNRLYASLDARTKGQQSLLHPLAKIAGNALSATVAFSPQLTEENRQAILDRVPKTDGIVVEGQKIITKGEQITPAIKGELESLSQARIDRGGFAAQAGQIAGTAGHAAIIVLLLVLYLKFIRRKIYRDNAQLLLMAMMLLFPAFMAFLSVHIQVDFPLEYFVLIPVTAMLLTILFDSRTGFYGTVVAALIVAGIRGNDYSVALAGLCAGAFAAYTVRDLRNRAQLFMSIFYIFIGYLVAICALSLEQATPLKQVGFELLAALGNSLVSPVITLGVLFLVENIFDTVSDLRLTEFDNINHPLLRELSMRAAGTYQHTMLVALLAENAANAIGANALLAKVGAYFHDVGKLGDPFDFVENQTGEGGNVHQVLSARESSRRVKNHVEQGIELAQAHGLPQKVIDFIPMHHGTLPISFFYQRALEEARPGEYVDKAEFEYQGPRPNTKETAIVMLADASEAVARALATSGEEVSQERVEAALDGLVRTRFEQGQLDQCDITARDLVVVRTVFSRLLLGLHHQRIAYPAALEPAAESAAPQIFANT